MSDENNTLKKQKIAFANDADMVRAALEIFRTCTTQKPLVGENEYATVVNAVTLDAESNMMLKFINSIDAIKRGGLLTTES